MSDSEDDYMSSKYLTEPAISKKEEPVANYWERRRKKLLSNPGYNKPRRELEKESRELGLNKRIDTEENNDSPGLKLLKKMGYEKGMALGKNTGAPESLTEPISVELKQDRMGLGMSTLLKKRKNLELEQQTKRIKVEQEQFRERVRVERLQKSLEGKLGAARRVCETLDLKKGIEDNVFWRKIEKTSKKTASDGSDSDDEVEEEEPIDPETEEFERLGDGEKLDRILDYMRNEYYYCFWCGSNYSSEQEMEELCPGKTEEEHD